jgi:hypothetical protein
VQHKGSDTETVCAALGVSSRAELTEELLAGLATGLAHTPSPLRDAVENLLVQYRGRGRIAHLERMMTRGLIDQMEMLNRSSAQVDLPEAYYEIDAEFSAWVKEYQEILYRLI